MSANKPAVSKADKRLIPFLRVIFGGEPKWPGFDDEFRAAQKASLSVVRRQADRALGRDWLSVVAALADAGLDGVLRGNVRRKQVIRALESLPTQTPDVRAAADEQYRTFMKWVGRRLKNLNAPAKKQYVDGKAARCRCELPDRKPDGSCGYCKRSAHDAQENREAVAAEEIEFLENI